MMSFRHILLDSFLLTLGLVGFVAFGDFVGKPLHARGTAQSALSVINGVADVISAPARRVAIYQTYRPGAERPFKAPRWMTYAYSGFLYFTVTALSLLGLRWRRRSVLVPEEREPGPEPLPEKVQVAKPPNGNDGTGETLVSRRAFMALAPKRAAVAVATTGLAGAGAYAMLVEPNRLPVTYRRLELRGLPPELAGLRIVHLSDIHHGPWLSIKFVGEVVARTNALKPDLILITGDHVVAGDQYVKPVARALAHLRPTIATLSTLGNHDWWSGEGKVRDAFREAKLPLIDNTRLFLSPELRLTETAPRSGAGLCLAGVGDFWEDETDFAGALRPAPDEMPRIVLSHNPDTAESPALLNARERVDVMLCGHTHGGQIRLPLVGSPVVPSRYGSKYARGLVQGPVCPVLISRGIGMTVLPVRFGVPPEIGVIELHPTAEVKA